MAGTDYNGWSNYETWCVHLHLTGDEGQYRACQRITRQSRRESADCEQVRSRIWTVTKAARFHLADALREFVKDQNPVADQCSLFADLMTSAMGDVDWQEVATAFLEGES